MQGYFSQLFSLIPTKLKFIMYSSIFQNIGMQGMQKLVYFFVT